MEFPSGATLYGKAGGVIPTLRNLSVSFSTPCPSLRRGPMKKDFEKQVRAVRMHFLDQVEPYRRDLYRYCRGLTGSVWDAEDLVQESLLRAFAKLSELHWDVENPRAWLFLVATNVWRDRVRRSEPDSLPGTWDEAAPEE